MPKDINFLTVIRRDETKSKKPKGLLVVRIIAIFYLILIVLLSVLFFYFSNKVPLDAAKKNENSLLQSTLPLKSREAKLLLIKDRIAHISEIIKRREEIEGEKRAKRANFEKIINSFREKIPKEVLVNTLNVEGTHVVVNLSSDSLDKVDDLIIGLRSLGQEEIISSLLLDSLSLSEDKNTYSILLSADL